MPSTITARLLGLASLFHRLSMILFGYFIPALSSVKAVVHKDSEAFFQWSTYWLILHLYSTVLSPILHFTLHPIFQLIVILWLSLPRFQGASVLYERIVVPLVKKYENQVDDAINGAHRGIRLWILSNLGNVMNLAIGEGGNLIETLIALLFGNGSSNEKDVPITQTQKQPVSDENKHGKSPDDSTNLTQPRHSVREALSQSSSLEDFVVVDGDGNVEHSMELMSEYLSDFKSMMRQGLFVFASVETIYTTTDDHSPESNPPNFRLGVFSYSLKNNAGAFLISPVGGDMNLSAVVCLPLHGLIGPICSGSQGIILEHNSNEGVSTKAEIVLSNQDDRDILYACLTKCLPWMRA
ncbi:hypothetical protein HJC23_006793 [Cyclotella cryptica]|uniref:Uncharacterized protein n=1 Tax=Cyclotella cryptica TaxID=29204 RepID=A0ABD3PFN9_9STRA|eukprot:CCRYP_015120-RA/>CCRYP_015120-RA protein AED:0.03 eAED:0.03 QI:318/1/1/1/0.5/0.33/3/51/352